MSDFNYDTFARGMNLICLIMLLPIWLPIYLMGKLAKKMGIEA